MKNLAFIIIIFLTVNISAQEIVNQPFSTVKFSLLGGPNFDMNNTTNPGYSILTRVQSNLTENLDLYLSTGYSTFYKSSGFNHTYYKYVSFDDYSAYHTILFQASDIKYEMIPVNVGVEYTFAESLFETLIPFATIDLGYSFSNAKANGIHHDGIAGTYNSIDEIPSPFDQTAPSLHDGSTFVLNFGLGVEYPLSDKLNLNFRYVYQHNDAIVDGSHLLFGLTF